MAKLTLDEEFNSLGKPWQPTYPWAQDGFTTPDQGSWLANPALLPADGNPLSVSGGVLTVSDFERPADVSPDLVGQMPRIGGQIVSEDTFSQQYGYFEIRMQIPAGDGFDGGFWLMPESGAWPPELDIAEINSSAPTVLLNTLVYADGSLGQTYNDVANMASGFHTYGLDWTSSRLTWYFDGKQTFSLPTPPEMNQSMYMIAGITSGAPKSWEGVADPKTVGQMKIDYIRVYDSNPYAGSTVSGTTIGDGDVVAQIGADTLLASPEQTFIFDDNAHTAVINHFDPASDRVEFWTATPADFTSLAIAPTTSGTVISLDRTQISLPGIAPSQLQSNNFLFHSN